MARSQNDEVTSTEVTVEAAVLTQEGEEFRSRGRTRVATQDGYVFRPSDTSLPEITPSGVDVTAEQAEFLLAESNQYDGRVFVVNTETQEG